MKSVSGKRLCRILEPNGWELKRINGSHHIYAKTGNAVRISVPGHGNVPLKTGLLRQMMKIAEIEEAAVIKNCARTSRVAYNAIFIFYSPEEKAGSPRWWAETLQPLFRPCQV